jgi:hypothetical protein
MTREEHLRVAEEFREKARAILAAGMEKYQAARDCGLGICGKVEVLDLQADTVIAPTVAATQEARQYAKLRADAIRAEAEIGWRRVLRLVDQLRVAEHVHQQMAEGLL